MNTSGIMARDKDAFMKLEKRASELLGEYFVKLHVGPYLIPCSSDYPEDEATVEVKFECPKNVNGKLLQQVLEELRSEFPSIYIWDIISIDHGAVPTGLYY